MFWEAFFLGLGAVALMLMLIGMIGAKRLVWPDYLSDAGWGLGLVAVAGFAGTSARPIWKAVYVWSWLAITVPWVIWVFAYRKKWDG